MQTSSHFTNVVAVQKSGIGAFRSVFSFLRKRRDYRHLRSLPDYLLDDAGLNLDDIEDAERENRLLG